MITVYNLKTESHRDSEYDFYIGRPSVLGNPYSHLNLKDLAPQYRCKDRDEAIDRYDRYFDLMYSTSKEFAEAVDEIYELYRSGKDIYLACFCKPERCHGDIIKEKLRKRLIKEKMREEKVKRNEKAPREE